MIDTKNLAVVRQAFAQTVFTHKVQEIAAEIKIRHVGYFKYAHILLVSSVLILLAFQAAHLRNPIFSYIGIGVSVGEVIFLIIQLSYNLENQVISHKSSALKYLALRDSYISLIADIMSESIKRPEIVARRNELQYEYQSICDQALQTGSREYAEAQR